MFRFTVPAVRTLRAAAVLVACAPLLAAQTTSSSTATAEAQSASQAAPATPAQTPAPAPRVRRVNSNRQARIARNIQDAYSHKWEAAGGGGYLRFHPGDQLLHINEVNFFGSAMRSLGPQWGIVADVRGNYGNAKIPNLLAQNSIFRPQISHYNFMAGVQYRLIGVEKYSVSLAGQGGVTMSKFGGDAKGLPSQTIGLWKDSNYNPTFSASVDLDYNIYNNLAARIQPTYVATTFGSSVQNSLGVNVGVVYRFGRR